MSIRVEVRYFARLREALGTGAESLRLEDGTHAALLSALERRHGAEGLARLTADGVRIAVNQAIVGGPVCLADGDEIGFLPPVTGG